MTKTKEGLINKTQRGFINPETKKKQKKNNPEGNLKSYSALLIDRNERRLSIRENQ